MWYVGSLFVLIAFLLASALVGGAVCSLLPWRIRPHATVAFAPILGLAVFVLMATAVGWLGIGFRTSICLPFTVATVALSVWINYNPRKLGQVALRVLSFSLVSSLGWFFAIIRFGAFNPYNDAFIYLVQAQWLQSHPFRTPAIISGQYPALNEVAAFQAYDIRMGASFLFGWVQATFGIDWSYLVYPAVILLPLAGSAIALAGMAFFVVRKNRTICLLGGMVVATTLNGQSFGSQFGFLHQTYGIAFAFAFLSLLGMRFAFKRKYGKCPIWSVLPCALPLAALLYSYPELSPFVVLAGFAYLAGLCLRQNLVPAVLDFAFKLTILVVLLVNVEFLRIGRSLAFLVGALAGDPVAWTPVQFLGHAAGFRSGAWDGGLWTFGSALGSELVSILLVAASCYLLFAFRHRIRTLALLPVFAMVSVTVLAFFYFRYFHSSPWNVGVGQSWDQFKLSQWGSIFVLLTLVCGCALAAQGSRWVRAAVVVWLLVWQGSGLFWNYRLADVRTAAIRQETGFPREPFEAYKQVRNEADFAGNEPIFLDLGGQHLKSREMVAYFLEDHPLASDWSDDVYLATLPASQQKLAMRPSMWILSEADSALPKPNQQRIGRFALQSAESMEILPAGISGGYDKEADSSGNWHWTDHSLQYRYKVTGGKPVRLRGRFTYLPAPNERTLQISITDGDTRPLQQLEMQKGWTPFVTQPFEIRGNDFSINFNCPQPSVRIGTADPRMLAFSIKNLFVEVTN